MGVVLLPEIHCLALLSLSMYPLLISHILIDARWAVEALTNPEDIGLLIVFLYFIFPVYLYPIM